MPVRKTVITADNTAAGKIKDILSYSLTGPNSGTVQALSLFNLLLPKLERMKKNRKRNSGLDREKSNSLWATLQELGLC